MTTDDVELVVAEEIVPVVPREARTFQGHRAGVVTRVVAATLDMVVVLVAIASAYLGFAAARFVVNPRSFTFPEPSTLFSLGAVLLTLVAYLTVAWCVTGRTYGDHVMGLRVVRLHGGRVGPFRAVLRALFCTLFPIGLFFCVGKSCRSLQDLVLRTAVVYDWQPRAPWRGHAA